MKRCPVPSSHHHPSLLHSCQSHGLPRSEPCPLGDFGREKGSAGRALQGRRGAESARSGSRAQPLPALFPSQQPCSSSRNCIPGTLGLPHARTAPPWIFKAPRCQELITACAAAASSPLYIISALALLLLYRSHLLTPNHPRVTVPVVPGPSRAVQPVGRAVALLAPPAPGKAPKQPNEE